MTVTLSHTCHRPAIAKDRGMIGEPIEQIICELTDELRVLSEQAVVALELRAGIVAGYWTPLAARHASLLTAHLTPQECADALRELGNMSPSKRSLDRLSKHLSSRWEQRSAKRSRSRCGRPR